MKKITEEEKKHKVTRNRSQSLEIEPSKPKELLRPKSNSLTIGQKKKVESIYPTERYYKTLKVS